MPEFRFPTPKGDVLREAVPFRQVHPASEVNFSPPPPPSTPISINPQPIPMLVPSGNIDVMDYEDPDNPLTAGRYYVNHDMAIKRGLIIMCHGQSADNPEVLYKTCFDHFARLLALNGYVAVSIKHIALMTGGSKSASDQIIENIKFFMTTKKLGIDLNLKGKPLALIGHSEGGMGVLLAGYRIRVAKEVSTHFTNVQAIVSMGTTTGIQGPIESCAEAVLIFQGTHDVDAPIGGGSVGSYLAFHAPQKYFMWMHGCGHQAFLQHTKNDFAEDFPGIKSWAPLDLAKRMIIGAQSIAAKNIAVMFALWKLDKIKYINFRKLFLGDGVIQWDPTKLSDADYSALTKKFKALPRYDIFTGTSPLWSFPAATFSGFKSTSAYDALSKLQGSFLHEQTKGWLIEWDVVTPKVAEVRIQVSKTILEKKPIFVEFQAIQQMRAILNNENQVIIGNAYFTFGVNNDASNKVKFRVEPSLVLDSIAKNDLAPIGRSVLSTVRLTMSDFHLDPIEIGTIKEFRLQFSAHGKVAVADFRGVYVEQT